MDFQKRSRQRRRESILCLGHPPTITAGTDSRVENLLVPETVLSQKGIDYCRIPRGGDHTGHEPGQIVIYLHLDLRKRNLSVGTFLEAVLRFCVSAIWDLWKIELIASKQRPGLYSKENPSRKVVSIGMYLKSYFTSFGIAINYENSMEIFRYIHPCGISAQDMVNLVKLGAPSGESHSFFRLYCGYWKDFFQKISCEKT